MRTIPTTGVTAAFLLSCVSSILAADIGTQSNTQQNGASAVSLLPDLHGFGRASMEAP
jgi:hypothetical protein